MSLFLKLSEDIKDAMRAKDQEKLLALRTLSSDVKKIAIDAGRREPSDEDVLAAAVKAVKQREDSAEQFRNAGREELASVEVAQSAWIRAYLPEQMELSAIEAVVRETIAEVGATSKKDMGKVMAALMPKVKGRADGKLVNQAVQSQLPA
jgi:uncharacterized protein